VFDELKNQWGWGGFTTQDLARCRLLAGTVALAYNWWSLFVRLADPEHHREALDQPTSVAVRHRVQNPARRSGEADHQQHPWQCATRLGGPMSVSPASWLSCEKCGAVRPAGKVVSHPQRSPQALSAWTPTSAAAAHQPGVNAYLGLQISAVHWP